MVTKNQAEIDKLQAKIDELDPTDPAMASLISGYQKNIESFTERNTVLRSEITKIYYGNLDDNGLYSMMNKLMKTNNGLLIQWDAKLKSIDALNVQQDDIESDFIIAMGNLLRDGYWSNQNYVPGQEQYLYDDAIDVLREMSKPAATYRIGYERVTKEIDIPIEEIQLNALIRVNDDE